MTNFSGQLLVLAPEDVREHYIDYWRLKELILNGQKQLRAMMADEVNYPSLQSSAAADIDAILRASEETPADAEEPAESVHSAVSEEASGDDDVEFATAPEAVSDEETDSTMLADAKDETVQYPVSNHAAIRTKAEAIRTAFSRLLWSEVDKVNGYFIGAHERLDADLVALVQHGKSLSTDRETGLVPGHLAIIHSRNLVVFGEQEVEPLNQFAHNNREGFRKICKKFDKQICRELAEHDIVIDTVGDGIFTSSVANKEFARLDETGQNALVEVIRGQTANYFAHFQTAMRENATGTLEGHRECFLNLLKKTSNPYEDDFREFEARALQKLPKADAGLTVKGVVCLVIAAVLCLAILVWPDAWDPLFDADQGRAKRALAILAVSVVLWMTSAIPLYATAILIIFLAVVLRIFDWSPIAGSKTVYQAMVSDNTVLVISGFALNAVLKRHAVDVPIAKLLTRLSVGRPAVFIALLMTLTIGLSTWLSNVAAPMLVISLVLPTLRALPAGSGFGRTVLLAICLAGNIGGMSSPIASPQSAIALQTLTDQNADKIVSFPQFLLIAYPICIVLGVGAYLYLMAFYRPTIKTLPAVVVETSGRPRPFMMVAAVAVLLSAVTLWITTPITEGYVGKVGIVSLIPIFLMFGLGLTTKADFIALPWDVVTLLAGGSVLGEIIKDTALLTILIDPVKPLLAKLPGVVVIVLCMLIMLVFANLMSHTVAALIILPFVYELSKDFHPSLAVMICALIDSGAMMLPVSSFPNISTLAVEDVAEKRPYITPKHLFIAGAVMAPAAFLVVGALGGGISWALGF